MLKALNMAIKQYESFGEKKNVELKLKKISNRSRHHYSALAEMLLMFLR